MKSNTESNKPIVPGAWYVNGVPVRAVLKTPGGIVYQAKYVAPGKAIAGELI